MSAPVDLSPRELQFTQICAAQNVIALENARMIRAMQEVHQ